MSGNAKIIGAIEDRYDEVLTPEALAFVTDLQRKFGPRRAELLERRRARRQEAADTGRLDFLAETKEIREDDSWQVAPPADLVDRRVEITGPTEKKMLVNALNSGAKVFMADFEDASAPNWRNQVQGQINLTDAIERRIDFTSPEGKSYALNEKVATLMPRPRGWHLPEKHVLVDDEPISGGLFDFGLFIFHNGQRLLDKGTRPYFYLPKMESHLEARLWNDVFVHAQEALGLERGTIRATVLIETIPAALEMEEILYELRDHSYGLNAGRWDYMFSMIKTFRDRGEEFLLPDRNSVTMTVPFMRAYTERLVQTCHKRGAFAMGGMAAFIPSRKDAEINKVALEKVAGRQEARGERRLRRHLGRTPGPGGDGDGGVRRGARRQAEPDRQAASRGQRDRGGHPRGGPDAGGPDRRRPAHQRRRRHPLPRVVAARRRRGRDPQPDGGRGDRGDLAVAGLAVGAQRRRCWPTPASR